MKYLIPEEEFEWEDHPMVEGAQSVTLFTRKEHGAQATTGMVKIPKGRHLDWHDHGDSDDILLILDGRAKMEIEGVGNLEMKKGSNLLIPGHVRHRIHDVSEDLFIYHFKAPPEV
ncbi:cupin domain-containing protein [Thermodesulfobacteriota bacterium]